MALAATAVHANTLAQDCLARNDWVCTEYIRTRSDLITDALQEHIYITVVSVALGFLIALPLSVVAHRYRWMETSIVGGATLLYTVPSLAMFSLLLPITGLSAATVIVGLTLYSLTILVRNILAGLDAVAPDVVESARGMGYGSIRLLVRVQLPLSLPSIFAGLRVAAVSTVALTTVGTIVGFGGFGDLLTSGLTSLFKSQVLTAAVLCVLLALTADLLLVGVQRLLTPWATRTA